MRMSSAVPAPLSEEARARGSLKLLVELWRFVRPYKPQLAGARAALLVAATTVLALRLRLRRLVAEGFAGRGAALLNPARLRSGERRVGEEGVSTGSSVWVRFTLHNHSTTNKPIHA